jgi:type II secretory ATPase GspE/PulE/Tfp pilus assembly ATPase PilB-like protein
VYELLSLTHELRDMIMHRRNAPDIAAEAIRTGHLSVLREDGFRTVLAGKTTLSEVARALTA